MNWTDVNKFTEQFEESYDEDGFSDWILIWIEANDGFSDWDLGRYNVIKKTWEYWNWEQYEETSKVTHYCKVEDPESITKEQFIFQAELDKVNDKKQKL